MKKLLVILGPTAVGKSDIAVKLAQQFHGEVISADSRQVYKGLDIGTGKITETEMQGIRHHLLDIADPSVRYNVSKWKEDAERALDDITARGKLPIVCGGTGFYISALIDNVSFPDIEVDPEEQSRLEAKDASELMLELTKLDPLRAQNMGHDGEDRNKRRLSRAILLARELGSVPLHERDMNPRFDSLLLGVTLPDLELKKRIHDRLLKRMEAGMVEEAKRLHANGLSYERMRELGLEYRYLAEHISGKMALQEMTDTLGTKIWQYARRQKMWWKRDKRIMWFSPADFPAIKQKVADWLDPRLP